jgi:hypothetical protein
MTPFETIPLPSLGEFSGCFRRQWASMPANDVGAEVALPRHADRSIQITGEFDGATAKIEGTIDGVTWGLLTDQSDNGLTFTSYPAGYDTVIEAICQAVVAVRPKTAGGGAGTNLTITLFARS